MHHVFNMTPSELQRMKKYSAPNSDERREEIESFEFFTVIRELRQWIHMLPSTAEVLKRGSYPPAQKSTITRSERGSNGTC